MMQPQQLRVLQAVRDHGSLTRAASALGYGVPTIAHHLATLERTLEVRLVDRDRRGARLTPLGAVLAAEADEILARLEQAERLVTTQRDLGLATIRVGTFASIGSQLLPRAIRELRSRRPVQVEVVEAEPTEVVARLHAGDLHAGLIYDSVDEPAFATPDLEATLLLEEDYRVLVVDDGSQAHDEPLDLADLAGVDWISSRDEDETSHRVLLRACRAAGFEPSILMRTDDLGMIHGIVAEGLACTIATPAALDTRFPVVARATVQHLGTRRTSFVRRTGTSPAAVDELHRILAGVLPTA
ncbi:LysR family transcriptional regulator [Agrococcus versicolor]